MPDASAAPDYRLHCRSCAQTFLEMADLITHREQAHEMRPPHPRTRHRPARKTAPVPGTPKKRRKQRQSKA